MKRKTIVGLIAVVAVIAMAMLAGCLEEEKASTVTVSTPTISATPAPTLKPTPAPTLKQTPKFKKGDIVKEDIVLTGFPKATIISWIRGIEGENYRTSMIHISPYFNSYSISDEKLTNIRTTDDDSKKIMTIDELQKYQNHEDVDIHNPDDRAPLLPAELLVDGYYLRIDAICEWSGSYGDLHSTKSVDGEDDKIIELESPEFVISAVFQNQEEYGYLGVAIVKDGEILNSEITYASYGVVSVSSTI